MLLLLRCGIKLLLPLLVGEAQGSMLPIALLLLAAMLSQLPWGCNVDTDGELVTCPEAGLLFWRLHRTRLWIGVLQMEAVDCFCLHLTGSHNLTQNVHVHVYGHADDW